MSDSELYTTWFWSLGIAGLVIVVAAALLIAILLTARSIAANARQALHAAEGIAEDTGVIWDLKTTNDVAEEILEYADSIERRGETLVSALHHEGLVGER